MSDMRQGLLLDETAGTAEGKPTLLTLTPTGTEGAANARPGAPRRRPPFRRRADRQLKLVLLPRVSPEPAEPPPPPLSPMDFATALGGAGASLRPLPVIDDSLRDALLEPGDTVLLGPTETERATEEGLLVALRVNDGPLCLRRMRRADDGHLHLQPEDPTSPAERVPVEAIRVEGTVVTIVRAPRPCD